MRLETRTLYSLLLPHNGLGPPRARPPERSGDRGAPRAKAKGVRGGEAHRIYLGAPRARPPERSRAGANRPLEQVCDSRKWAQFRQSQVSRAGANRPLEQVCDSRKWAQFRQSQVSGDRGAPRAKAKGVRGGEAP